MQIARRNVIDSTNQIDSKYPKIAFPLAAGYVQVFLYSFFSLCYERTVIVVQDLNFRPTIYLDASTTEIHCHEYTANITYKGSHG